MTATEKRIGAFCARRNLGCEWQALKYNGRRAVVESEDRDQHAIILSAARRLKGTRVNDWTCSAGGVWEGHIFLQDEDEASRIDAASKSEMERVENWWTACHRARLSGLDYAAAAQYAESLYPASTTA